MHETLKWCAPQKYKNKMSNLLFFLYLFRKFFFNETEIVLHKACFHTFFLWGITCLLYLNTGHYFQMPCKHDLNSQQFWHSEIGRICQTKKSPWKKSIQLYWSSNDAPMWRHFACSLKKEDGKLRGDIKLLTKWHDNGALLLDQFLQKSTCILLKTLCEV